MLVRAPPRAPPTSRWPVRTILFGIVFALVLPGLAFAAILLFRIAGSERSRSQEVAEAAALRTAESLDHEVTNLVSALLALATSPALDDPTPDAFARQARTVGLALGHNIVLSTTAGQQLVNSGVPPGQPLPRMGAPDTVLQAVRTQAPALSGIFRSPTDSEPGLALMVPRVSGDRVTAILAINLRPSWLAQLLAAQGLPLGWTAAVTDGGGQLLATPHPADAALLDLPGLRARLPQTAAIWLGPSSGGTRVLSAMRRAPQTEWRILVTAPVRLIEAPLRSTVALLATTGVAAMLIAGFLAWRMASSLRLPLQRLAAAGSELAQGRPVQGVQSAIAEVDAVSRALVRATDDLRQRNAALAKERAQLAAIIQTVPVGIIIAEAPSGRLVATNRFIHELLREALQPGDGDGTRLTATHADGTTVRPEEYPLARVLAGAPTAELTCLGRRTDGTTHWVKLVAAPIHDDAGQVSGVVVAVLDIDETVRARLALAQAAEQLEAQVTERTLALSDANQRLRAEMQARAAAEEQLRQSQKMEAVGQLTGGLAHDFNNLLTIVMGSLDLLRRRAADDRARRLIDNALEGANRAATLTARLLAFSRRQPLQPQPIDANALIAGMSGLLHTTLGDGIQLETALAPHLWLTNADPNQLENALLNLAANARDAIRGAETRPPGTLSLLTGNATLAADALAGDPDATPGDYVRIAVADNGAGMPPDVAAHVFEPFFTTKPIGRGTGLGLSQVHGFVKQSGGHVALRTAPGHGTVVTIYLPRLHEAAHPAASTPLEPLQPGPAPTAGMTVLVVEDEDAVRRYSAEALRELGHAVLEAEDGPAALHLLETRPEIDLVFTDVMLPAMSGPALADLARQRRPALPILFTSGFDAGAAPGSLLPDNALILPKPFTLATLAELLHRATTRDAP